MSASDYPVPADEAARQGKVSALGIVDSPPEQSFDDITALASEMCDVPIALVAFMDHDRQWFKSRVNLPFTETKRGEAFCIHVLEREEPLVVPDTKTDPRFSLNPHVVNDPGVRFYCGVPLRVGGGSAIGTLCVLDFKPRDLSPKQLDVLRRLGRQIERELQHRHSVTTHPITAPPPRMTPLQAGDRVGDRYTIVRPIREGGVGALLEARDTGCTQGQGQQGEGGRAAIKVLLGKWFEKGNALERFVREARILRQLKSKHVCKLLDVGNLGPEHGRLPYLVLEYLEGTDLADLLAAKKKLPWREAVSIAADACVGLAEAHALGVVHRDIKPSNIFLDGPTQTVKVIDFGIAKSEPFDPTSSYQVTQTGSVLGTLAYMPPEQMLRPAEVGPACDVWSVGATLYELIAGTPAFPGDNDLAVCSQVLMHHSAPIRSLAPEVPAALESLLQKTMAKDAAERHASIADLERDLRALTS